MYDRLEVRGLKIDAEDYGLSTQKNRVVVLIRKNFANATSSDGKYGHPRFERLSKHWH